MTSSLMSAAEFARKHARELDAEYRLTANPWTLERACRAWGNALRLEREERERRELLRHAATGMSGWSAR